MILERVCEREREKLIRVVARVYSFTFFLVR